MEADKASCCRKRHEDKQPCRDAFAQCYARIKRAITFYILAYQQLKVIRMEKIEWEYSDNDSLARVSKLTIDSKTVEGPFHATTKRDDDIYQEVVGNNRRENSINVVPEALSKTTLDLIGSSMGAENALISRLTQKRSIRSDINVVYTRIPKRYEVKTGKNKSYFSIPSINQLQITSLVDVSLQCNTDIVVPPIPNAITSYEHFKDILNRTKNQIQTFKKREKPIMGYIPSINEPQLVVKMIDDYLKNDCRIFGVDFSGSSNNPALMATVIGRLRDKLKVRKRVEEYYLHVFNAATVRKSEKEIAPVTNWLTHLYGVDSVSGTIWGGRG